MFGFFVPCLEGDYTVFLIDSNLGIWKVFGTHGVGLLSKNSIWKRVTFSNQTLEQAPAEGSKKGAGLYCFPKGRRGKRYDDFKKLSQYVLLHGEDIT